MPNFETHCKISKTRTGRDYKELHKWMDEAIESLKYNHRLERHFFNEDYKDFIEKKWGKRAVVEWLFHIALDNLETANKFAVDIYSTPFGEISISFKNKEMSGCKFIKQFPNSKKTFEIDLLKRKMREIAKADKIEPNDTDKFGYTKEELILMGFDENFAESYGD